MAYILNGPQSYCLIKDLSVNLISVFGSNVHTLIVMEAEKEPIISSIMGVKHGPVGGASKCMKRAGQIDTGHPRDGQIFLHTP